MTYGSVTSISHLHLSSRFTCAVKVQLCRHILHVSVITCWTKQSLVKRRTADMGSRALSTLETILVFLFVAMTGACIGLIVIYFVDKDDSSSTHIDGESLFTLIRNGERFKRYKRFSYLFVKILQVFEML